MDRAYLAKSCVGSAKALNSKALPDGSLKNMVAVHGVVMWGIKLRDQVGHDLVAKQVEVNPLRTRPTFFTTEYRAVKLPCQSQIGDRKRNMKWINFSHLNTGRFSCF
jgi:hypothetical protein